MRLKTKSSLLDLTNKFLSDFSEMASSVYDRGNTESYSFNYLLMNALSQTDFVVNRDKECGFPTPSAGINLFTSLFEVNIQELFSHLKFIFDNIDSQLNDDDKIKGLKLVKNKYHFNIENQNVNLRCELLLSNGEFKHLWIHKGKELIHDVEKGYIIDTELVETIKDNTEPLNERVMIDYLYLPNHFQFRYIRDINAFYSTVENIYNEIKDEL